MALNEVVIEEAEVIFKLWLQIRITHRDVLWIGIVHDGQQLAHRRLIGSTFIVDAQVALLVEAIAEV